MSRSRTARNVVASAADVSTPARAESAGVTTSEIARRAFDLYLARDRQDGHDVEDWLQAEQEFRGVPRSASQ